MQITVNGEPQQVSAQTLAAALDELGYREGRIATAVNGDFVPAPSRGQRALASGDRIEVVAPKQGG